MDKMTAFMEKYFLPLAHKIGTQRHLAAIKDGFIATMPIALVGALAAMFSNVLFGANTLLGEQLNRMAWYANTVQPFMDATLLPVVGQIWWATIAMSVLFSTFTIAYNLTRNLGEDPLAGGIAAIAAYLVTLPQGVVIDDNFAWGTLSWNSFNSQAVFAGLIVALLAAELFAWVKRRGWVIKMPDTVPPAVSKSFSAIIPTGITLIVFGAVAVFFLDFVGMPMGQWINYALQQPLVRLGQSPATLIFLLVFSQLLWFFGLHGMMIIEPALTLMYGPALSENQELVMQGLEPVHVLTRNFLDVYGMHGGSGSTLALLIAILILGRKASDRMLAKMAFVPGVFQINEPVIYGLPIVLNPIFAIPFIFGPALNIFIAWFFTAVVPFAGLLWFAGPWTTPPVISAFLASGGDWGATIIAAVTLVLSIFYYIPFVILSNREAEVE